MSQSEDNERYVRDHQEWMAAKGAYRGRIDGWAGTKTRRAAHALYGFPNAPDPDPKPSRNWPGPSQKELRSFYGPPGARQVLASLPYPMRLAWDPDVTVERTRCHELVAASLQGVLEAIRDHYGSLQALQELGLDLFGGVYNLRKMRDRELWSVHAWGAAIDLDPVHNGLRTPWPGKARMPERVFELFEAEGWTCLGRVIGRDAMHAQASGWF